MSEEKKKKNKIIGISIGLVITLLVVISGTYAYWQISRSQEEANSITSQCLKLEMENQTGTFGLEDVYPMSDSEGLSKTGFTFDVVNTCNRDIAYVIGMDSIEIDYDENNLDGYIEDKYIKVAIDNIVKDENYDGLEKIDHEAEDNKYTIRNSKEINTSTVKANSKNTHNIKAWIDIKAPLSENNRVFGGRVFITGGQFVDDDNPILEVTADSCFTMDGGEIIGYDESCGKSVVIPATVNGTAVTTIDTNAFKGDSYNYPIVVVTDSLGAPLIAYVTQPEKEEEIATWAQNNNFGDVEIEQYTGVPTLESSQMMLYCDITKELNNACVQSDAAELTSKFVTINELDLSQALNLEFIEAGAFSNFERGADYFNTPAIAEQLATKPVSLTSLKFAKTDKELIIGWSAFNGIDVDTLEVYTNLVPEEIDYNLVESDSYKEYFQQNWTGNYFAGAKVKNLVVSSVQSDTIVSEDIFEYIMANQIIVNEGVTEIGAMAFHGHNVHGLNSQNISLPNSLVKVGKNAFTDIGNIVFESGTCDGIEIENPGWDEDSVLTPSTCQP